MTLRQMAVALALAVLLALPASAHSQARPDLWLIPIHDTVLVQIPQPPAAHHGFVVDRVGPDNALERLTSEPVRPERQPALAAARIGDDLPLVMRMMDADDEAQVLRRMQADPFAAGVASSLFRSVATVLGRIYLDTTARSGVEYEYRVTFLDASGQESGAVHGGRVRVMDVQPVTPAALVGEAGNDQVTLRWSHPEYAGSAADMVVGFHVYRAEDAASEPSRITLFPVMRAQLPVHEFVDPTVRNGHEYRYQVRSLDLGGRESAPTAIVLVSPVDNRAPLAPQDLVTEPGDGIVRLVWRMSPELDAAGYHVERSTGLDQPFVRINDELLPADTPMWTDEDVRGDTQYFYRVLAVNARGQESEPGNAMSAVPEDDTAPEPPASLSATVASRQVQLEWEPSPSDDVQGYHVYRGDDTELATRLTTRPVGATSYLDTGFDGEGLNPGKRYTIRVAAVDHAFNESPPVEIVTLIPDDEPPAAPTALRLRNVEGRSVEITWSPGGSLDVAHYTLTRTTGSLAEPTPVGTASAGSILRLDDRGVQSGVQYDYQLVAVDSAGNESLPVEASIDIVRRQAPPAPRRTSVSSRPGGIVVTWERVVDDELVGYRVYRSDIPTGVFEPVSPLIEAGEDRSFIDVNGAPHHYYTVRAVDRSGNESRPGPATSAP